MNIWVDADACPVAVREIIYRAANRTQTSTTFVANSFIKVPPSKYIHFLQVQKGFDVADDEIVERVEEGDLVVTSDIPLAAEVIEKKGQAISPRGEEFNPDNVRQRLNIRDFMDTMRSSGVQTGGPPPMSQADRQSFANLLDRALAKAGQLGGKDQQ